MIRPESVISCPCLFEKATGQQGERNTVREDRRTQVEFTDRGRKERIKEEECTEIRLLKTNK